MNNVDSLRGITRRHFWDAYRSPLTCVLFPVFSGSASGETTDIGLEPTFRAAGPTLSATVSGGSVTLTWTTTPRSYAAVVYRANVNGGPFAIVVSGVLGSNFVDIPPNSGTFYYRTTLIDGDFGESDVSNVVAVTV